MPTLEELLRASLKSASARSNPAHIDLHAAVVEAAKAVEAVTNGRATVRLLPQTEDGNATCYDFCIVIHAGAQFRKLASFTVTASGYPIYRHAELSTSAAQQFASSEELVAYFRQLASDPDSPLVGYLAFIVRNQPAPV